MNVSRKDAGRKAKAFGDLFEIMFRAACRKAGIAVTQIPSGCKSIGKNKLIRVKTPFDWICSYQDKTALIDTKTCLGDSFPYSKICEHQLEQLGSHAIKGAIAGYVIWLRKSDEVIFVDAEDLQKYILRTGSIQGQDGTEFLGSSKQLHLERIFIYA